jgi:phosphomannomutase/phosphoglucomutase
MSETSARRLSVDQMRPLLPYMAGLFALLALWLAFVGWRQWQGDRERGAIEAARDLVVQETGRALRTETGRLVAQLATPAVQSALAAGDLGAAAAAIERQWPQAEQVGVLPAGLGGAYQDLSKAGFGRIAVAEAALAANAPMARVARDSVGLHLLVAAPAKAAGREDAVAIARLPMGRLTPAFAAVEVDDGSYLALRQGEVSIAERGDPARAASAEALASAVPGSGLRVAAAVPRRAEAPFGMGALPALVAALVLGLLAAGCTLAWRRDRQDGGSDSPVDEPTLVQALQQAPSTAEPTDGAPAPLRETEVTEVIAEPTKPDAVSIDSGIFRAYDIRGIVGQTLDADVAEHIGQAIGSLMHEKELPDIVVGRDGRLSGPELVAGLINGLRKAGRNVIDIGLAPTPLVYFGSYWLRTGCCVAVTGSHNPPDYNGFKIVVGGETLSGAAITDLYERIAGGRLHAAATPGGASERRIDEDYVRRIADDVQLQRPLKVVVDAGNGVAGEIGPRVLEAIGAQVVPLYCEIDGTFPNHHPDPSEPHNLEDLIATVRQEGADLGLAFDGDGDRLGVVTSDGENIYPDRLLMLFASDVLERNPGAVILYDVKCTGHLSSHVLRHGGSPLMWKTGHSLIKAKMRETDAALAGEMSGHFFFAERWFGFDDGIYAAARLLEILAARDEAPGDLLRALPGGVSTPEIKIEAPGGDPHGFVEGFRQRASFEEGRVSSIDGVRVDWPDGWGLVRASNTTPVLVLRFDADNAEALERIKSAFREQLMAFSPGLPILF